jgi:hypothetical protein
MLDKQRHILINPLIPLIIRVAVLAFVLTSLGIASELHEDTAKADSICGRFSDIVYIIIWTVIASCYLILVALDEFRAAPIGLRRPWTKFVLTVADFIFISFFTAAISLVFSMHSDWHCDSRNKSIRGTRDGKTCGSSTREVCKLVRTLSGLMVVSGFSWAIMFAVTISRLLAHAVYAPGAGAAVTLRRRGTIKSSYRW